MKKYYHLIGIIILVAILLRVDFHKVILQFSRFNILIFILISSLIIPGLFCRALRWKSILRLQGIDYPVKDSFLSYIGGIYAGMVTPGRIGESVKAIYLKQDKGVDLAEGMASVFADRFLDFYFLLLLGGGGFAHFMNFKTAKYGMFISLVLLFILLVPFLLLNKNILERITKGVYKNIISGIDRRLFEGQFKSFFNAVKKIIYANIGMPVIMTIASYVFYFLQCYMLARLISVDIAFITVVAFVSISSLVSILPITVLGIGTRELSLVYLFSLVNLKTEAALAYSFLLFLSFYVISGILAFAAWFIKGQAAAGKNG